MALTLMCDRRRRVFTQFFGRIRINIHTEWDIMRGVHLTPLFSLTHCYCDVFRPFIVRI